MKIVITWEPSTALYCWKLYDGPDGAWEYQGKALSLGQAYEDILIARIHCSQSLV